MGSCMSWQRMLHRNGVTNGYDTDLSPSHPAWETRRVIGGDCRRIERDQRDERHLARYAESAGITAEQAQAVLDLFFNADCEGQMYA